MDSAGVLLLKVAEESLRFEYDSGDVTRIFHPHTTGWRVLPSAVSAHVLRCDVRLDRDGVRPLTVRATQSVCIPPGLRHCFEMTTMGPGVSRWSHFNFRIFGSVSVFTLIDVPVIQNGRCARRIGDLNAELAEISKLPAATLQSVIRKAAAGFQLLQSLAEGSTQRPHAAELLQQITRLAPVLRYIEENLSGDLSREALAEHAHLSPSRFHAVFRQALGVAPVDYVLRQRVRRAQQLLISSDLSVREISTATGFGDAFHFSRLFKKRCGSSPAMYREQARKALL
jgi:AraC-like DNA-binding protein